MTCEDQALCATKVCRRFECQAWADGKPVYPDLVRRGRFWCCPKCGASYGEAPHPDLRTSPVTKDELMDCYQYGKVD